MEKTVNKSRVFFFTDDRNEEEIVLSRFESGERSPGGMLAVAEYRGPGAMAAELERYRDRLAPEVIALASQKLALLQALAKSQTKGD